MSPMATSLTFESARSACVAAPVPRPPQPIRPIRSVSLPAAWTAGASPWSSAAPARPAVDVVRKSRRVPCGDGEVEGVTEGLLGTGKQGGIGSAPDAVILLV